MKMSNSQVLIGAFAFLMTLFSGCTTIQRVSHMYGSEAQTAAKFAFKDGGETFYYTFTTGDNEQLDTFVFFYGGSGCPSWKQVMPGYVEGLQANARIFAVNKRFVGDRSTGIFDCGNEFNIANKPDQWYADLEEFVRFQLAASARRPRNVALVGVSEGALVASMVASRVPEVTHLGIIGSGAYPLRKALAAAQVTKDGNIDIAKEWEDIKADPTNIQKTKYGHPYRWWVSVLDIDPTPNYLRLGIPILIGIGEKDESHPAESALLLQDRFREMNKNNLTIRVYPGANHRLAEGDHSYRRDFFRELSSMFR